MKKKILLIIALFIIGIGGFLIKDKIPSTVLCKMLSEEKCKLNEECMGIYGPSSCNGNVCTADITFKSCKKVNNEELARREEKDRKKEECEKLGANFHEGYMRCYCTSPFSKREYNEKSYFEYLNNGGYEEFVEGDGCKTSKEICEKKGGEWKSNVKSIEKVEAKSIYGADKVPQKLCKNEDTGCYAYPKKGQGEFRCFFKWDNSTKQCDLTIYNKKEINKPCKIGNEFFTGEELFNLLL